MNSFIKSEINSDFDLISNDLKKARLASNMSLEEVSLKTKINIKYLIALENGDFLSLPKGLYGKNFLKQYASYLGLSLDSILEIYNDSDNTKKEPTKNLFSNQVVKNKYFLAIPKLFRNILISAVVLIFFSYLLFSFQKLNSAPSLIVSYPPDNFITNEKYVEIKGLVEKDTNILINGDNILVNLDGTFVQRLNLKLGINKITIEAKKKYGKKHIIEKQIMVKD
ncbi:MAG: helix-turn-helix domain-containing protein [Patescibacteria group bacterium]|nr:helix-turn-helix domain-containing protein [Patescibacteria group bacterium]